MQNRLVRHQLSVERRILWRERSRAAVELQPQAVLRTRCGILSYITMPDALQSPGEVEAHNMLGMYPADLLLIIK